MRTMRGNHGVFRSGHPGEFLQMLVGRFGEIDRNLEAIAVGIRE